MVIYVITLVCNAKKQRKMSVYTEIIKDKIASVCQDSSNIHKCVSVDSLLDKILKFQQDIKGLTIKVDGLTDLLINSYSDLERDDFEAFKESLKKLIDDLIALFVKIRKKPILYSGVKTVLKEYHNSYDNLREWYDDFLAFKINLPEDNEFNRLVKEINSLHT